MLWKKLKDVLSRIYDIRISVFYGPTNHVHLSQLKNRQCSRPHPTTYTALQSEVMLVGF